MGDGWGTAEGLLEIERSIERKERLDRSRNVEIEKGKEREKLEELMREIGAEIKVEDISRIGVRGSDKGIWLMKLGSEEQKREVMRRKKGLKGRREKIEDDLTPRKRKMKWRLKGIAREREGLGMRVWMGYGKTKIDGEWRFWDEEKEMLRDGRGVIKGGQREWGEGGMMESGGKI